MVYCSNETVKNDLAVTMQMNFESVVNATEDNYYIYLNIPELIVKNVTVIHDKVGIFARDYSTLLNIVAMTAISSINDQWTVPYDFRSIDPQLMFFITTVFSMPRVSPFYMDQFIYMGISYQFDLMALTSEEKAHLESRALDEDSEKLLQFFNLIRDKYFTMISTLNSKRPYAALQ